MRNRLAGKTSCRGIIKPGDGECAFFPLAIVASFGQPRNRVIEPVERWYGENSIPDPNLSHHTQYYPSYAVLPLPSDVTFLCAQYPKHCSPANGQCGSSALPLALPAENRPVPHRDVHKNSDNDCLHENSCGWRVQTVDRLAGWNPPTTFRLSIYRCEGLP